jgi:hypothetical protein
MYSHYFLLTSPLPSSVDPLILTLTSYSFF